MTLGDGLEQSRFTHVGQTNDTTLQVVAGAAQQDLLLGGGLLGGHFRLCALGVGAARGEREDSGGADGHAGGGRKGRTSCRGSNEAGERSEGGREEGGRRGGDWSRLSGSAFCERNSDQQTLNEEVC